MSIKTLYVCEKCKKESEDMKEFGYVSLSVYGWNDYYPKSFSDTAYGKTEHWCIPCLNSVGVFLTYEERKKQESVPTLEDMIREIVREEIPQ